MSCRHDLAVGTCVRCYPSNPYGRFDRDRVDPGPEDEYEPNLEGPGACTCPPMWPLEYGSGRHHPKCPQRVAGSDSINHPSLVYDAQNGGCW